MPSNSADLVEKVHPATRELLPDDPLEMHAFEVPGDPELMLRMVAEEYARMGANVDDLVRLARDPFYQGLHRFWLELGEIGLRNRLTSILRRCGVVRTKIVEHAAPPEVVPIQISTVK